jgi:hypothetical protein
MPSIRGKNGAQRAARIVVKNMIEPEPRQIGVAFPKRTNRHENLLRKPDTVLVCPTFAVPAPMAQTYA